MLMWQRFVVPFFCGELFAPFERSMCIYLYLLTQRNLSRVNVAYIVCDLSMLKSILSDLTLPSR